LSSVRNLFEKILRLRGLPVPARYAITTLLVLLSFGVCQGLGEDLNENTFLVFFPVIILAAMLFDRGNGFYAVALSAAVSIYYFLPPYHRFAVERPSDLVALLVFVVSGAITAALIETLHGALEDLATRNSELRAAHADLTRIHQEVQASERQKDLLMQEMSHRTKNDLMLVSSLVQMQSRTIQDPAARRILTSAVERIHVLGNAHTRLTRAAGAVVVDARDFMTGLCDDLRAAFVGARPVALLCDVESHALSHQRAVAIGLIANELVTNAMKHAFPDDRDGTVRVAFERRSGDYRLTVEDDGIGATVSGPPAGDGETAGAGLGQRLVRSLTLQLRGRFDCAARHPGTICTVTFPAEETTHPR
jgi:two-component system, sensor histidine kinase PdtaS